VLDKFEKDYERVAKQIIIQPSGQKINAVVYVKKDNTFEEIPSETYLQAIHQTLSEVPRSHKHKIMIRYINPTTGKIAVRGYWTPKEGIVLY